MTDTNGTDAIDSASVPAAALDALQGVERFVRRCGLDPQLVQLVKLLASYRNGCAYCIDMHTKDARACGETEQRLYAIPVWGDTPFFNPRERAALAWTETLTRLNGRAPGQVREEVRRHFSEAEIANLTMAIIAINMWNRLTAAFRYVPGTYVPARP